MPSEQWLDRWQQLAGACITGGKIAGCKWTLRVSGRCPATHKHINVLGRGATVTEAMTSLLNQEELKELQCHPKLAFLLQ